MIRTITKLSCSQLNQIRFNSCSCQCYDLYNKVVVITGGAEGIGYEIADKFLQKGARSTVLLDTNEKLGDEAAKKLSDKYGAHKAVFYKCDVCTDLEPITRKVFCNNYVDIFINNAGILDGSKIRETVDINMRAVVEWGLKFWEHMSMSKCGKGGMIMNLASIYGYRVDPFLPIYQSTKFGVMGFTKSLGHPTNYAKSCVKVVALCPGFTTSSMTEDHIRPLWDKSHEQDFAQFLSKQLWQKLDVVGDAAIQLYECCPTGTAWVIEGSKPIFQV